MNLHRLLILIVISFCIVSILAPSIPAYARTPPEENGAKHLHHPTHLPLRNLTAVALHHPAEEEMTDSCIAHLAPRNRSDVGIISHPSDEDVKMRYGHQKDAKSWLPGNSETQAPLGTYGGARGRLQTASGYLNTPIDGRRINAVDSH